MDGHGDGEHSTGNAISINTLARWRVRRERGSNWGDHFTNYIDVSPMYCILETLKLKKNSQETRNGKKLPQLNKGHL